jgi:SEL1 protein
MWRLRWVVHIDILYISNIYHDKKNFKLVVEKGDWHDSTIRDAQRAFYAGDMETAFLSYLFAAEKGIELAQENAAWLVDKQFYEATAALFPAGHDLFETALTLWNRAALQGNVDAKVKVGDYFYYGMGMKAFVNANDSETVSPKRKLPIYDRLFSMYSVMTGSDPLKASQYYRFASDVEHHALAKWNLGYMYEYGIGLKKDYFMAKRFYTEALQTNPDGYMAVNIALWKIRFKEYLQRIMEIPSNFKFWLSGTKKHTTKVESHKDDKSYIHDLLNDDNSESTNSKSGDTADDSLVGMDILSSLLNWFVSEYDNELFDLIETGLILFLCGVTAGLIWWRHVASLRQQARLQRQMFNEMRQVQIPPVAPSLHPEQVQNNPMTTEANAPSSQLPAEPQPAGASPSAAADPSH